MEESVTYQAIMNKGRREQACKNVLLIGTQRFGTPPPDVVSEIESIDDLERLEQLILHALIVSSWEDLLDLPHLPRKPKARRGRKSSS